MTFLEQLCLFPKRRDQGGAALYSSQRPSSMTAELSVVLGTEVWKLMVLPVAPQVLDRIQLGGVGGKELEHDPPFLVLDVLTNKSASVASQAVPDDQQLAGKVPLKMAQELDHLGCADRTAEQAEVEIPPRDPGYGRQRLPIEVKLQHRGLSLWRPSTTTVGPLAQSTFVDEDDRTPLFRGVFFRTGQRRRFQRRIASSSRSKARPAGRCTLQPSCRRMRHT